jgi:hypothetical protein
METLRRAASFTLGGLLLATLAHAGTIVVDVNGGPGHHFTDLPPAIAAAQPGDLILVRVGKYSNAVLDKGLTILGEGDALSFSGSARLNSIKISNVGSGPPAVLVNLRTSVAVDNVETTVVLEGLASAATQVTGSRDVRLYRMLAMDAGLDVTASRVEVVSSNVFGRGGTNGQSGNPLWPATDGGPGLVIGSFPMQSGRVHLALSSVTGGPGGWYSKAGDGGFGVSVHSDGQLIVAGSGFAEIRGGTGGYGDDCHLDGNGGTGLFNQGGQVYRSGVALQGGDLPAGSCGIPGPAHVYIPDGNSFDVALAGWDPTLTLRGQPVPGQPLDVELNARDGSQAFVFYGSEPVVRRDAATHVELLVAAPRRNVAFLGQVGANNQVVFQLPIPAAAQQGDLFFMQAIVVLPSGQYRRTNSVPVFVR